MANLESVLQATTVSMLRVMYPNLVISLSMSGVSLNGSARQNAQTMQALSAQGFVKGLPDLVLYLPESKILNLEFKRPSGGIQSADQIAIQAKLTALGHNYHLVRSYEQVFQLITEHTTTEFREEQFDMFSNSPAFKLFPQLKHLYNLGETNGTTT